MFNMSNVSNVSNSFNLSKYRFDLVFSYWIFAWYILYMLNVIQYSPKLVLIVGTIENSLGLVFGYFYNINFDWSKFWEWFSINFWIKLVPLYTVWNTKINFKRDATHIVKAFGLYVIWTIMFGRSSFLKNIRLADAFKRGEKPKGDVTPMMLLIHDVREWLRKQNN